MKKINIVLFAVCAGVAFTACNKEANEVENTDAPLTEIFATSPATTRTALATNGTTVNWSEGDAITVIGFEAGVKDGAISSVFHMTGVSVDKISASFFGEIDNKANYMAVYPVQENKIGHSKDGTQIENLYLEPDQCPVKNGYDPAAGLIVASFTRSTAKEVEFKHVCAYAKITITKPARRITLNIPKCSGACKIRYDVNGKAIRLEGQNAAEGSVSLHHADDEAIEAGTYLLSFIPSSNKPSNMLVIEYTDGTTVSRNPDKTKTFDLSGAAGKIIDLGTF